MKFKVISTGCITLALANLGLSAWANVVQSVICELKRTLSAINPKLAKATTVMRRSKIRKTLLRMK